MWRKMVYLIAIVALAGSVGTASAYDPGIILKCDAEGSDGTTQLGWMRIGAGINLDVNNIYGESSGINVTLATGNPLAIEARQPGGQAGPLREVENDFFFANDENKSPENDFILTLSKLQAGFYRVKSYHHRADEPPKPCYDVTVAGAASVVFASPFFMQDHAIMTLPAQIVFQASTDQDVVIRYRGPDWADPNLTGDSSPQIYFNGFTLEYFGAGNPLASGPTPEDRAENECDDVILYWTPAAGALSRNIYFGTSPTNVSEGATPVVSGYNNTDWDPPAVDLGKTYYWRIDERKAGADPCAGIVWRFTTNDGNAFDLFPGDGWRGVATDVILTWMPGCQANSHKVFFGTGYSQVQNMTDPCATRTLGNESYDPPGALELNKWYYWRIDEVGASKTWKGKVMSFKTGFSGVALYYKFDGTLGASIPSPLTDYTGNVTFTKFEDDGSLTYGESNPVVNKLVGTSASFEPNCGLYRLDTGDNDILRLDGYQYTIEMWVKANTIPDVSEEDPGAILFGKSNRFVEDEQLTYAVELRLDRGVDYMHRGIGFDTEGNQRQNWRVSSGRGSVGENEWYHIAAVFDLADPEGQQKLYIDGKLRANAIIPGQNTDDVNAVAIGMERTIDGNSAYYFDGLIDELRVTTKALAPEDFLLVPGPEWARGPNPSDKQTRVDPNVDLTWTAGTKAKQHKIFFGTGLEQVVNMTDPCATKNLGDETYDPGPLDYGTTFYWRVDEVNGLDKWEGVPWWFRTRSYVDDVNQLLWYKFDETYGYEAWDSSGHDLIGAIIGPADGWDPNDSYDGDGACRIFDDDTSILVDPQMLGNVYKEMTVSVWLKDAFKDDDNWVFRASSGQVALEAAIPNEDGQAYFRAGLDADVLTWDFGGANPETIEGWHHWVFTKNENDPNMRMHFDGTVIDACSTVSSSLIYLRNNYFIIGDGALEASADDLRVYDYALSPKQVEIIFRMGDIYKAWGPKPFNGQSDVLRELTLTWKPGDYAAKHDVYFGTDFNDVNDADANLPVGISVYKGRQARDANSYSLEPLDLDKTYYWRVDEVNEPNNNLWKGRIWRFRVANYIIVEDFESYDPYVDLVNYTWLDGVRILAVPPYYIYVNGAAVSLGLSYSTPPEPVHSAKQSMWLGYFNDGWGGSVPFYSETERTFDAPQDWTVADVKILTLFFYGDPNNDANLTEQMYAGVNDDANHVIKYGYYADEDMNDIKVAEWQQWDIGLADFGATLTNIKKMYIGFGDRYNPVQGGVGAVYFDDIRLYRQKCVPWRLKPAGDLTDDCIVDFEDIQAVANEWLRTDVAGLAVQNPGSVGLVGWWKLEQSDSNAPFDYSYNGHNGVLTGSYRWTTGYDGNTAPDFDNGRVLVPDHPALRPTAAVSASAWVYYTTDQGHSARVVCKGADNKETFSLELDGDDEMGFLVRDVNGNSYDVNTSELWRGEWIHFAGTFDGASDTLKCYVNGQVADSRTDVNFVSALGKTLSQDTNDLAIGNRSDDDDRELDGTIDDVRLYSRALSEPEVAWLATDGTGYVPLRSRVNLFDNESTGNKAVNLKDLAKVAEGWRDKKYWPPL
ncbi:MAG TPA: LamG domain-containing protein [Sedimentisphaerales bacterium]|nr:LamG domain-containing protein [Sedimentisphaerales bacterium]